MFKKIKSIVILLFVTANGLIANPITVCSHGIADTYKQAFRYAKSYTFEGKKHFNDRFIFAAPFATFNYPHATESFMRVNVKEASMAQDNEINRLKQAVKKAIDCMNGDCTVTGFGLSCGASTWINLLGTTDLPEVKAVVLESPFDSATSIVKDKMKKFKLTWLPISWGETLLEQIFMKYSRDGIKPIETAANIRKDLPILIVCSRQDQLVPYESTIALYNKLVKTGHTNVHLYVADHGKHSKILWDLDGETYQNVVHAFYQKYGLPHNVQFAQKGVKYL